MISDINSLGKFSHVFRIMTFGHDREMLRQVSCFEIILAMHESDTPRFDQSLTDQRRNSDAFVAGLCHSPSFDLNSDSQMTLMEYENTNIVLATRNYFYLSSIALFSSAFDGDETVWGLSRLRGFLFNMMRHFSAFSPDLGLRNNKNLIFIPLSRIFAYENFTNEQFCTWKEFNWIEKKNLSWKCHRLLRLFIIFVVCNSSLWTHGFFYFKPLRKSAVKHRPTDFQHQTMKRNVRKRGKTQTLISYNYILFHIYANALKID